MSGPCLVFDLNAARKSLVLRVLERAGLNGVIDSADAAQVGETLARPLPLYLAVIAVCDPPEAALGLLSRLRVACPGCLILAIDSVESEDSTARCFSAGAHDVLRLPFRVSEFEARLAQGLTGALAQRGQRLRDLSRALPRAETLVEGPRQRLDTWGDRLPVALERGVARRRVTLSECAGALQVSALRRMLTNEQRRLDHLAARLAPALERGVARKSEQLAGLRISTRAVEKDISYQKERLERAFSRITDAGARQVGELRTRLEATDRLRETLGYRATLARGYAVVRGDAGLVTSKAAAEQATGLEIEFADGRLKLGSGKPARGKSPRKPPEQGSLF